MHLIELLFLLCCLIFLFFCSTFSMIEWILVVSAKWYNHKIMSMWQGDGFMHFTSINHNQSFIDLFVYMFLPLNQPECDISAFPWQVWVQSLGLVVLKRHILGLLSINGCEIFCKHRKCNSNKIIQFTNRHLKEVSRYNRKSEDTKAET